MNEELIELLVAADSLLGKVSVAGDNVFILANARQKLLAAYNIVSRAGSNKEGDENG